MVLDAFVGWDKEYRVIERVIAASGRPATFTLASGNEGPPRWRRVLEMLEATNAAGGTAHAQVMPRPIGLIAGLELTVHPFVLCPSWEKIAHLPIPEQVAAMRDPALRAALLAEEKARLAGECTAEYKQEAAHWNTKTDAAAWLRQREDTGRSKWVGRTQKRA